MINLRGNTEFEVNVALLREDLQLPVGYIGLNSERRAVWEVVFGSVTTIRCR